MSEISCVDLFCGVGGLTHGLQSAGIDVQVGIDIDRRCGPVYEQNTGVDYFQSDVTKVTPQLLEGMFIPGSLRLLAGCAPCQPFSSYGRTRKTVDERWNLLTSFGHLVGGVLPELVTLENVPGLMTHSVFSDFLKQLSESGYNVRYEVLRCEEYGIPQTRRRLVLVASRIGEVSLPKPGKKRSTVRDAIANLPKLAQGEVDPNDPLHKAAGLSPINRKRIRHSKPGGTWRDWPEDLVADCHQNKSGSTYPSVYGRMQWDKPSPTITTQCYGYGNGRFGHPEQNRAISLREAALLQTFPKTWLFAPKEQPVEFVTTGRAIGNAVPPMLGKKIGQSIIAETI